MHEKAALLPELSNAECNAEGTESDEVDVSVSMRAILLFPFLFFRGVSWIGADGDED